MWTNALAGLATKRGVSDSGSTVALVDNRDEIGTSRLAPLAPPTSRVVFRSDPPDGSSLNRAGDESLTQSQAIPQVEEKIRHAVASLGEQAGVKITLRTEPPKEREESEFSKGVLFVSSLGQVATALGSPNLATDHHERNRTWGNPQGAGNDKGFCFYPSTRLRDFTVVVIGDRLHVNGSMDLFADALEIGFWYAQANNLMKGEALKLKIALPSCPPFPEGKFYLRDRQRGIIEASEMLGREHFGWNTEKNRQRRVSPLEMKAFDDWLKVVVDFVTRFRKQSSVPVEIELLLGAFDPKDPMLEQRRFGRDDVRLQLRPLPMEVFDGDVFYRSEELRAAARAYGAQVTPQLERWIKGMG